MKDKKEKLEGLLERLTELRKETDLYTTNLINEIKDIVRETNRETEVTRLIPFDITKAKQGAKVVTRDRNNVRILCFDSKNRIGQPIVAEIYIEDQAILTNHAEDGTYLYAKTRSDYDLFIEEECV